MDYSSYSGLTQNLILTGRTVSTVVLSDAVSCSARALSLFLYWSYGRKNILIDHAYEWRRRGWLTDIVENASLCVEEPVREEESSDIFNILFPKVVKDYLLAEMAVKFHGVNVKHRGLTVISMAKPGGSRFLDNFETKKCVFTHDQGGPLKVKSVLK